MTTRHWDFERLCGDKYFGLCKETVEVLAYYSMDLNNGSHSKEFELKFDWPDVVDRRSVSGFLNTLFLGSKVSSVLYSKLKYYLMIKKTAQ